jgi:hypothetical protein
VIVKQHRWHSLIAWRRYSACVCRCQLTVRLNSTADVHMYAGHCIIVCVHVYARPFAVRARKQLELLVGRTWCWHVYQNSIVASAHTFIETHPRSVRAHPANKSFGAHSSGTCGPRHTYISDDMLCRTTSTRPDLAPKTCCVCLLLPQPRRATISVIKVCNTPRYSDDGTARMHSQASAPPQSSQAFFVAVAVCELTRGNSSSIIHLCVRTSVCHRPCVD